MYYTITVSKTISWKLKDFICWFRRFVFLFPVLLILIASAGKLVVFLLCFPVWHMWIWYLGEPDEANTFRCEIAIKKRGREEDSELKYSGRCHSIRIPPHRIILSGCLLSFSDYTAAHFRYLGEGHQGHPVIDYKVSVSRFKKTGMQAPSSNERVMAAGLSKMLRRFSIDTAGSHHKANKANLLQQDPE